MVNCFVAQSNTFQAVVARSGVDIYAIALYTDGLLQWTREDHGFPHASVGYYKDGVNFSVPGSETCSIIHTASRTNVNNTGMFVFHLNEEPVIGN